MSDCKVALKNDGHLGYTDTLKGLGHTILGNFREFWHGSNSHRIN